MKYLIWDKEEQSKIIKTLRESGVSEREIHLMMGVVSEANAYHNIRMIGKDAEILKLKVEGV